MRFPFSFSLSLQENVLYRIEYLVQVFRFLINCKMYHTLFYIIVENDFCVIWRVQHIYSIILQIAFVYNVHIKQLNFKLYFDAIYRSYLIQPVVWGVGGEMEFQVNYPCTTRNHVSRVQIGRIVAGIEISDSIIQL